MADTPNILVIMADDHGQWASGPYGNRDLHTPAMDHLAQRGVRMANAFTPTPVCSPARASFFTGRLPSQHGIQDYLTEVDLPEKDWLAGETTLPQLLQAAGYQTALVGKWHCGRSWLTPPGFDYWLSYQANQRPHRGKQRFVENGMPLVHDGYQTPFLTGKALQFLRGRDAGKPFFLFVGYVDTHSPFADHPDRLVSAYRQGGISDLPVAEPDATRGWARMPAPHEPGERLERLAQYYAAVTMIDEQIGALLDDLEGRGELASTLVVYTADHGHMNGQHGLYTKGNATVPQNFYEESIRIPALLSLPGCFPADLVRQEPVDHLDLFQTLLDVANCRLDPAFAADRKYPGHSYLPLLEGQRATWREEQFCEYGNARMLRTARYKLVRHYAPHAGVYPDELYDLRADPGETHNRIADTELSAIIAELDGRLEAYFARYEQPERSAKNILSQPLCNNVEPWRIARPV
ncbi:MAG TPA: sulfatase-like hydrolase/transferase [Chloroflexota bacterium]|nr:sulfatase-like hydrolase/transferase [Chloroflexota bacterium]